MVSYNFPTLAIQPEEAELLTPKDKPSVSQWAVNDRVLSKMVSKVDGPWTHFYSPSGIEIMDSLSDQFTREVWVQGAAQFCKTEIGLNWLGRTVCCEPGYFILAMPREDDADDRIKIKVRELFKCCPALMKHIPSGRIEDINIGTTTVFDNMIFYPTFLGSAAALADRSAPFIWADEIGKAPQQVQREGDPINLLRDRTTTYSNEYKLYAPSTPVSKDDLFDRNYKQGDGRKEWLKCFHCGQRHIFKWEYVDMEKDSVRHLLDPNDYLRGGCCKYVCPECGSVWTEQDRWKAVTAGVWAPRDCRVEADGRIIGKVLHSPIRSYHAPFYLIYPGFLPLKKVVAEWAEANQSKKTGDIAPLKRFINTRLAEPFEEREKETEQTRLITHIGNYVPEVVPRGVAILTAGIDVQIDHVWVTVQGWGYMSEVWSIFERRIETGDTSVLDNYQLVKEFLAMSWPLASDKERTMGLKKIAIDCGYRDDVIFDFCRQCRGIADIIPVRGSGAVKTRLFTANKLACGTLHRYDLNTDMIKDKLHRLLFGAAEPGPGYFHLHKDTTPETLSHLTSEEETVKHVGRRMVKEWLPKGRLPNHLWDANVYALFAAELAGASLIRDPNKPLPQTSRKVGKKQGY